MTNRKDDHEVLRTKSGQELTPEKLDKLAREAEAGYDLSKARRVRRALNDTFPPPSPERVQRVVDAVLEGNGLVRRLRELRADDPPVLTETCGTFKHYVEGGDISFSLQELSERDGHEVPAHRLAAMLAAEHNSMGALLDALEQAREALAFCSELHAASDAGVVLGAGSIASHALNALIRFDGSHADTTGSA